MHESIVIVWTTDDGNEEIVFSGNVDNVFYVDDNDLDDDVLDRIRQLALDGNAVATMFLTTCIEEDL